MRRARIVIECAPDAGDPRRIVGTAVDLVTRSGAEYLIVQTDDGKTVSLRLDYLRQVARTHDRPIERQ